MAVQEKMSHALTMINQELKGLKKKQKAAIEAKRPDFKLNDQIERREKQKRFYTASKTEPVRFQNGVVVNAKLIRSYLKKLPRGAVITTELSSEGLKIRWKTKTGQGCLACLNLAHRYESFTLPAAELLFEGEIK